MRLELTLCKEAIKKYFSFSIEDGNLKMRINNNSLVVSDELVEIWKNSFDDENLKNQFMQWFYSAVLSQEYIKKVKLASLDSERDEENIIIDTCNLSKDKIIVTQSNSIFKKNIDGIKVIKIATLNSLKKQRISVEDINSVFDRNNNNNLFSLYETPITIDVALNSDSLKLAKYIAIFYRDSNKITIKDVYLDNNENLRNFKNYILPFINKSKCEITLLLHWEDGTRKRKLENIFNNMNGYNIRIKKLPSGHLHDSFIEGDKYKLSIGYRLKLFGGRNDGLTEQESISITKK